MSVYLYIVWDFKEYNYVKSKMQYKGNKLIGKVDNKEQLTNDLCCPILHQISYVTHTST